MILCEKVLKEYFYADSDEDDAADELGLPLARGRLAETGSQHVAGETHDKGYHPDYQ